MDELVEAFTRNGITVTKDELDRILKEHDDDEDGMISFDEFKKIFIRAWNDQ